jgi:hypothetical protein
LQQLHQRWWRWWAGRTTVALDRYGGSGGGGGGAINWSGVAAGGAGNTPGTLIKVLLVVTGSTLSREMVAAVVAVVPVKWSDGARISGGDGGMALNQLLLVHPSHTLAVAEAVRKPRYWWWRRRCWWLVAAEQAGKPRLEQQAQQTLAVVAEAAEWTVGSSSTGRLLAAQES